MRTTNRLFSKQTQDKKIFLSLAAPLWQKLDESRRKLLYLYYGLDLPGDNVRTKKAVAIELNLKEASVPVLINLTKRFLKSLDPSLPFKVKPYVPRRPYAPSRRMDESGRLSLVQRHREKTIQYWRKKLAPEKKTFLGLVSSPLWEGLAEPDKQIITLRYRLELPNEEIMTLGQVAEILGLPQHTVSGKLNKLKRLLKGWDPNLPFAVPPLIIKGQAAAVAENTCTVFTIHNHQWEQVEPDREIIQAQAQQDSSLDWFVKQGLVPARYWHH